MADYPKSVKLVKEKERGLVPAASHGRFDDAYNGYLHELDPLGESERSKSLQHALATAKDGRFREFLERLGRPRYRGQSLATIAKTCDITLPQFADFWNKSQTTRALAYAQEQLLDVTKDIVADAKNSTQHCERCDGFGFVVLPADFPMDSRIVTFDLDDGKRARTCPLCSGNGVAPKSGNKEARQQILEMTGMGGKKGGPMVQVNNNNFAGQSMDNAQSKLGVVSFTFDDDEEIIDAETVEIDNADLMEPDHD